MAIRRTTTRRVGGRRIRDEAAAYAAFQPHPNHVNNGEEAEYRTPGNRPSYVANYSKALPHTLLGEADRAAYRRLLRAIASGDPRRFEGLRLGLPGSGRRLTNPQAGFAFDLEGPDAQVVTIPPAPRIDEPENSGEMGELYWMALLRDVHFADYGTGAGTDAGPENTAAAAASLTSEFTAFTGPRDPATGSVTPGTLFRGFAPGDLDGPYLSQFLLMGSADPAVVPPPRRTPQDGYIRYGTLSIDQRQRTILPPGGGGTDFMTTFPAWLAVQNGADLSSTLAITRTGSRPSRASPVARSVTSEKRPRRTGVVRAMAGPTTGVASRGRDIDAPLRRSPRLASGEGRRVIAVGR